MIDTLGRLRSLKRPISAALIGMGSAGKGLLYQSGITPGIDVVAIADIDLEKAIEAARMFGRAHRVVEGPGELEDTITRGLLPVCQDGEMLARCQAADVLIDATSAIEQGGRFALAGIETGKDLVMMNSEADLIFGPHLMRLAQDQGLVYTSCDGDQPACVARLVNELELWGFELVIAGNVKGYLDRYSNPTSIIPEARKRFLDPKMCASYTDGTKLSVEMALVANAYGLRTMTPGMRGPGADKATDVLDLFDCEAIRQGGRPVVDYILGSKPPGGVFVVGYCENAYQRSMLGWFPPNLGEGPFYVFERPYHLVHVEAMRCIAEAVLDREALLQPTHGLVTDVYTYAKRPLRKGEKLDGIGGHACYGLIENRSDNVTRAGLPICLAEGVAVDSDVAKDEKVYLDQVIYDAERLDYRLYRASIDASGG